MPRKTAKKPTSKRVSKPPVMPIKAPEDEEPRRGSIVGPDEFIEIVKASKDEELNEAMDKLEETMSKLIAPVSPVVSPADLHCQACGFKTSEVPCHRCGGGSVS